jgi:hypothetical protein
MDYPCYVKETVAESRKEFEYAKTLAQHAADKFYPENESFELCNNLMGVLTQIDNMLTGLRRIKETVADRKMSAGATPLPEEKTLGSYADASIEAAVNAQCDAIEVDPYAEAKEAWRDGELQVHVEREIWEDWGSLTEPAWKCFDPKDFRRKPKTGLSFVEVLPHFKEGGKIRHSDWGEATTQKGESYSIPCEHLAENKWEIVK